MVGGVSNVIFYVFEALKYKTRQVSFVQFPLRKVFLRRVHVLNHKGETVTLACILWRAPGEIGENRIAEIWIYSRTWVERYLECFVEET